MSLFNLKPIVDSCRKRWRHDRMKVFVDKIKPHKESKILDIGGLPELWELSKVNAQITLLNLPKPFEKNKSPKYNYLEGDICDFPDIAANFDIVFSNSVLEHIGSDERQEIFANIVLRAPSYWIQVPAPTFPIEVHCRVLFWWYLPEWLKNRFIEHWHKNNQLFKANQMLTTRPVSKKRLRQLFPSAKIEHERFLGFTKSYYLYDSKTKST